ETKAGAGYCDVDLVWLRSGRGVKWWPHAGGPFDEQVHFGVVRVPEGELLSPEEVADWLIARGHELPPDLEVLATSTDAGAISSSPRLLHVYDKKGGRDVALDITGAERFDLEDAGEHWNAVEGFWNYTIKRRLYRLKDGRWFHVSERFHWEANFGC